MATIIIDAPTVAITYMPGNTAQCTSERTFEHIRFFIAPTHMCRHIGAYMHVDASPSQAILLDLAS